MGGERRTAAARFVWARVCVRLSARLHAAAARWRPAAAPARAALTHVSQQINCRHQQQLINAHLGRPGGVMPFTAVAMAAECGVWL